MKRVKEKGKVKFSNALFHGGVMKFRAILKGSFLCCAVIALLTFLGTSVAKASLDNKGTEFIMSFITNYNDGVHIELHLTSDVATDVTVEYPVNTPTFTTTVGLTPGNVTIVSLPINAHNFIDDSISNNAVHAFSDNEFVCYMINRRLASSDAALALPVDTMNTEFIVMDYNPTFGNGAEFAVVAGYDNTTVTITPATNIVGHPAGVSFTKTLNRGEVYFAASASNASTNTLTGTIITSDRPVGLTNGDTCVQVPTGTYACDHIFEVGQPTQTWGNKILVANLPNRPSGSIYRIVASQDGTNVTQDGVSIGAINRGEYIETAVIAGNHVFEGDKPIFVAQFMTGQGYAGATLGDPAMSNMIPSDQYFSAYTFSTVGEFQFEENYVTIIAEDADVTNGTILLDGAAVGGFSAIGTSGFQAATVSLTSGVHTTSSVGVHGITVEGYNDYDSYIYPGGALFEFINPVGDANPPVCEIQIVAGNPPSATGTATDNRPSEDTNNNGVLDEGEDLNSNGQIDTDTGIFFVELEAGAVNLTLNVDSFVPGDVSVSYTVELTDPGQSGSGVVKVTDGAGNTCESEVVLEVSTAVSLVSFTATNVNGEVHIEWVTATEIDNAGFNIYRAKLENGTYTKINGTLISANGNATSGASYSYVDTPGRGTFYYKLEDVDYNGVSTMHGHEKVRVRSDDATTKKSKKQKRK
ncbi:MAG: IgGFc-binding protein [Candidatus Brocadia sp.]|nr:IgGFc-binding protein [Candidatus Brocadia sp.]